MHEFLVLHYLATDSAREWDVFLDSCLPVCTWVRAGSRRALAHDKCHIAPSHRRFAHPSWIAGMKLMLDLLLSARKHRYLGRCLVDPRPAQVYVRGFSAGSYSGICLLHLLWNMPHVQVGGILGGISCPPALLHGILPEHGDRLMLIHLATDRLCQWHPYDETLSSLNCKYCIVDRSTQELREHFGTCEHSYGHWIDLSLPHGRYPLYQLLRQYPDVALPQARDIAPLRLVSWVSCEVPDHVQQVLHQLMTLFGEVAPVSSDEVLAIGVQQLGVTSSGEISWDMVRDALIREVTFGGTTCPTEEVCRLMAAFLQRLPLPRLVHFLDMILPQMVPVQSPCQSRRRRFASSYRIAERTAWGEWDVEYTLNATKLFWSRSGIMHVAIAWDHKPLLLLATPLLPNRTTESFEREAGPPYDKQRIQMGLRSGNTVLICFWSGVGHFQSVLIALAADLHTTKPWQGQHKFWKYVSPIRTYFACLPERLARTYCSAALDRCSDLPYGEVHHLQGSDDGEKHSLVFQNIYHIGDTKSAQELEVFLHMSRERLRLCCGLQCTDRLHPNGLRQRQKLFHAALKLLWFAIGIETVHCENEAQVALHAAIRPLLRLEDGHVLATLSAIVLALCEGRTGLAISGVFGAGKTRSAAVLLAGLLVFDPSLKLMVLTKENIAAHAVAEHLVSLQMPDYLQEKMGRLVGYYEQNHKGSYTPLDILPSNRNQVIRQKSFLIGCGGGFQQECSQQFSPVADWMGSVDLFLEDEGQQYGNMEEAATVARTPATCLEVWSGDHRQTPGGLKKSKEAKAFRKKFTKRPLALRCQTQYIQAHDFGNIVMRYLDWPKESFAWKLRQLLTDGSAAIDPAVGQFWHELIGDSPPRLSTEIQRAAYAILWMGLRGEREGLPSMLATSFAEAAGVSGRQKWGLVLSSSARVFQVTYQTVVGVRYPELVTFNGTQWKFGKYVPQERPLRGGFLPIFWDVPRANIHAVEDIGAVVDWLTERCEFQADAKSNLAVLHHRNDMTNLFRASNWVSSSHDSIVSRGVTTCAGMTAHTVLLAQTKVGFLTGGRKKSFLMLPEDEQMVQLEEAYARAIVAITRARSLCLIMGPLDMKGLLGAATVMGTLLYGGGHVWAGHAHFYLHDEELSRSPSDETFIDMLQQNCCLSGPHFPPPAIVEALQDYVTHYYKVRRLHLIVVDLWRPWKYNTARAREITDQLWRISHGDDTRLRMSELPGVASKGWAILYSVGNLHNRHACTES